MAYTPQTWNDNAPPAITAARLTTIENGIRDAHLAAAAAAQLSSPVFTGNPTAPTPALGDNDTSVATTAFVTRATPRAITPMMYGAIGDGVATSDDAAAINAAIAASAALKASSSRLGPPVVLDRPYYVNSPVFLESAPLIGTSYRRGEIHAMSTFSGGLHVIRNWLESDYTGGETDHNIPPTGRTYQHYFHMEDLYITAGFIPDLGCVCLSSVQEGSVFRNLTFSEAASSGSGKGSIGFRLSGTATQGIAGMIGLDNFLFYSVGWKNEIKIGEVGGSVPGSEVTMQRWTSAPGAHQGSVIDITLGKVSLNDFHSEAYVDPALAADTDLAIIRSHTGGGFQIVKGDIQVNPTSLLLQHPAVYLGSGAAAGTASPLLVNLTLGCGSGTGWDTGISMLKDNSTSFNPVEIPFTAGTQSPSQIYFYDGNIYSRKYPTGNQQFRFIGRAAAPTSGHRAEVGDITWNSAPVASGTVGWVCVTAGNPGTWKTFGAISA